MESYIEELPEERNNDFYCDFVLNNKITVIKVYEDELVLAYHHTKPSWPIHLVVLPKEHIASVLECDPITLAALFMVIKKLSKELVIQHGACRILTNLGKYQDSKHLHWHLFVE